MPRISARQRVLQQLQQTVDSREEQARIRHLFDEDDPFEDEVDSYYASELSRVTSSRYMERGSTYRKRDDRWKKLLYDNEYLNDTEFLAHFRVTRDAFRRLLALVCDDPVYRGESHRTFRGNADLHLLVLLKFLGTCGNGNTNPKLALFFGMGSGSIPNYVRRATKAILKLKEKTLTWPDDVERKIIARRMQQKYDFVNCVGMIDGTLLPLATKPTKNGEDYFTRKGGYAIHSLITCDDVARIRHVVVGWPGSVHDNRVWRNCDLSGSPHDYFRPNEYLLGDSAFQPSSIMVPAHKKPPKAELDPHKNYFNTKLAKARIKTEHCIGLLKTRFQYFKSIRAELGDRQDMKKIIQYFTCACILHNLLISEPVPLDWEIEIGENGLTLSLPNLDLTFVWSNFHTKGLK